MLRNRMCWFKVVALGAVVCFAAPIRAADLDKMVPEDAQAVFVVNFRQALDSPLSKKKGLKDKIKEAIDTNKEAQAILAALNLDPLKDIDSLLVAASDVTAQKPEKVMMVLRGTFDPVKLAAAAEKNDKFKASKEGNRTIYEINTGKDPLFATIVNKNTIAGSGSKDYLLQSLKGTATPSKELVKAAAKADGKQCVWMALVITEKMKAEMAKQPGPGAAFAPKLSSVNFGVHVTDAILVGLNIIATDNDTPVALKKQIDMGLKQVEPVLMFIDPNVGPILADIVKTLKVTAEQNTLNMNLKVTEEVIDKLIKLAGMMK